MTATCPDSWSQGFRLSVPHSRAPPPTRRCLAPLPLSFLCGLLRASPSTGVLQGLASASAPKGEAHLTAAHRDKSLAFSLVRGSEPCPATSSCVEPLLTLSRMPEASCCPEGIPTRTPARAKLKTPNPSNGDPPPKHLSFVRRAVSFPTSSELRNQARTLLHTRTPGTMTRVTVYMHRVRIPHVTTRDCHLWANRPRVKMHVTAPWVHQEQVHCYHLSRKMHVNKRVTTELRN